MENLELKGILEGIRGSVEGFNSRFDQLQKQVDAIDTQVQGRDGLGGGEADNDISALAVKAITESAGFAQMKQSGRGRIIIETKLLNFERKAPLTSGSVVPYQAVPGIADSGRPLYGRVRQLMRSFPITTGSAQFVRETAFNDNASPVAEDNPKSETTFTLEADTAAVQTIAHWSRISRQLWDDLVAVQEFIRTSLLFGLEKKFEEQLLAGDGNSPNLNGLVTQATDFDTSLIALLNGEGYNPADYLRAAILQLAETGYGCTGFIVSPRDWFKIETQKDANRNYSIGDPRRTLDEVLWSLPIVPSPAMTSGAFLAGDFDSGAHIRNRMDGVIDISDSDSDNFTKNLYTIRAEQRAALVVAKPGAFITGTLTSSPA